MNEHYIPEGYYVVEDADGERLVRKPKAQQEEAMSKPFRCVVVAEGEVESTVYGFDTQEELSAFSSGVGVGSGLYGKGSCCTITLDELEADADDFDEEIRDEVRRLLAR